jgi:glycosyltransferase involved in cell wall biosynthesis
VRIAWVLYGGLDVRTGGTIYDAAVVRALRAAGDVVHVVSLDAGSPRPNLTQEIEALGVDIVVGDELCFRELGETFPKLGRVKRVLLVHHLTAWEAELDEARRSEVRVLEQKAIDSCDAIVTTSWTTRTRLVAEGASIGIEVVLPGADRLSYQRTRDRHHERDVRFVFIGSVVSRKRVLELVRAFGAGTHTRDGAQLVLVGSTTRDSAYVAEVRAAIARLGIADRVVLTGEVDETGVARALDDADALVMPSSLEGYGIAATEAIRVGVPVIATRAAGLVEALAPCPDATLFVGDEETLAAALHRFATDAVLRESMTNAARAAAPKMPTWAACGASFREALAALVSRTTRARITR